MSRLLWVVPIIVTLTGIFLAVYFNSIGKMDNQGRISILTFLGFLAVIAVSIAVFYNNYAKLVQNLSYRLVKTYTPFIYNSIRVKLEYLKSDGSLVSYERDDDMIKLSLKKNEPHEIILQAEGGIIKDSTSSINSSYSFPDNNTVNFSAHFNRKEDKEKQHHFTYSAVFKDSFLSNNESWTLSVSRVCKQYCVDIILPRERELVNATLKIKSVENPADIKLPLDQTENGWTKLPSPKMCYRHRKDAVVLSIRISDFKPFHIYKIGWNFKN